MRTAISWEENGEVFVFCWSEAQADFAVRAITALDLLTRLGVLLL